MNIIAIKTKKPFGLTICLLLTLSIFTGVGKSYAITWQEMKGEHFILYYSLDKDKDIAKEILDRAEVYYRKIALELGYPRYSEFWTWDKRVKIYIYPDRSSFLKATDQPSWSHGMADYKAKEIASFIGSEDFLESILPHEMAHLIFRDFVGFEGEVPLWLDEGVAQWSEERKRQEMKAMIGNLYRTDSLLSLEDLMKLDIRLIRTDKGVYLRRIHTSKDADGVLLVSGEQLIKTYYLQAVSVVGFLIEKYGSDSFATFCRQLRDGKSLEDALKFAYSSHLGSLKELEERWRDYLSKGE